MITETEFDQYVAILRLSDDQRAIAEVLYADYFERRVHGEPGRLSREYHDAERAAIEAVARAQGEGEDLGKAANRIYGELDQKMVELNRLLDAVDESFLTHLATILNDDQVSRIERVRNTRKRVIYRNGNPKLPGSDVDIIDLLHTIVLPGTLEEVEQFIADFEPGYVAALEAAERTEHEMGDEVRRGMSIGHAIKQAASESERERLRESYKRVRFRYMRAKIHAAERIVSLNQQALTLLTDVLAAADHESLTDKYRRAAYPKIFPDSSAEPMIAAALALDDLDEFQRDFIEATGGAYRVQYEQISRQLVETTDEFWRVRALSRDEDRQRVLSLELKIDELREQRDDASDNMAFHLDSILGPQQFERLPRRKTREEAAASR